MKTFLLSLLLGLVVSGTSHLMAEDDWMKQGKNKEAYEKEIERLRSRVENLHRDIESETDPVKRKQLQAQSDHIKMAGKWRAMELEAKNPEKRKEFQEYYAEARKQMALDRKERNQQKGGEGMAPTQTATKPQPKQVAVKDEYKTASGFRVRLSFAD